MEELAKEVTAKAHDLTREELEELFAKPSLTGKVETPEYVSGRRGLAWSFRSLREWDLNYLLKPHLRSGFNIILFLLRANRSLCSSIISSILLLNNVLLTVPLNSLS